MNFQKCSNDFQSLVYRIRNNPAAVHPEFSSFSSRFKTFKLFPKNTFQNKYTLSECGLKYSGVDDVVECFCCGLILHNWERLDDPWIEHCRFSPRCLYVLLMKDFCRLKQLQHCVDLYIAEKQKRLPSFQTTFDAAYELIKNDVRGLPISCQRNEFTNQYIQNYDFSYYSHLQNDDTSFLYEILQFHFNVMSDMILHYLIV
ncbi:baculoviral IAP repeat-containing protein 3-like [Metopolophium dirhodum]|uniref:baculoviral IAP repeat-containing protein 3-like n=1 Tax=Metopolophium dirhodum TaxID=44670 RepID=UPI0029907E2C|nr:baculoviral IAP repeat-containing protein 3-like [Metopolophium dirhodum]